MTAFNKKIQQQGKTTKEDKSLGGTTTKLIRVIPVTKKINQNNLMTMYDQSPRVATIQNCIQYNTIRTQLPQEEETSNDNKKKRKKNKKLNKNNHTTRKIQQKHTAPKQRSTDSMVCDTFYRYKIKRIRKGETITSIFTNTTGYVIVHSIG